MKNVILNNGLEMPVIGCGINTFGKVNNSYHEKLRGDTVEVDMAIDNGYRHFDTAQAYRNEEVLGESIAKSGIVREEFFITTKLNTFEGYKGQDWLRSEVEKSLNKLRTEFVDMFLIHNPWDNPVEMAEAWSLLEEYYNDGTFKAIGVSNFSKKDLEIILGSCQVVPAVNQIESHVSHWNDDLIAYNTEKEIKTTAWSPLRGLSDSSRKVLGDIGDKYGKTFAQVILRYQIERDVIVIPKSHNKERQAQNLDVFDFVLSNDDRERIARL
ncbi:MAG TPA: aldo/keto reductase [Clostridiaceae bacterium]|nr:aldo/keto reductase [Clostridiaceae bacterium]